MPLNRAAQTLTTLPLGTRVVVRYRIPDGLTDALGYLRGIDDARCTVETRTSDVVIELADVQAAKEVPPPPPRRSARGG
ncbi:putative acetyltransferase [Arthrobacter pigmenti]